MYLLLLMMPNADVLKLETFPHNRCCGVQRMASGLESHNTMLTPIIHAQMLRDIQLMRPSRQALNTYHQPKRFISTPAACKPLQRPCRLL